MRKIDQCEQGKRYILIYWILYISYPIFYDCRGEKEIKIKVDREYGSTWFEEVDFLMKHGIRYTFVKEVDQVTVWKFKKNENLFLALAEFYKNVYLK